MQVPLGISNRFSLIESLCPGDCSLTTFTCENWKSHLPCIYAKLGELIPLAGTTIAIGEEKHEVDNAIKALTNLASWIDTACCRSCEPFSELVTYDDCVC